MRKLKKVGKVLAIILAIMVVFTAGGVVVGATGVDQQITAILARGITVRNNSQPVTFTNAAGQQMYPILYQGSTYLPLRAMAELFDVSIEWDGSTRTVLMGDTGAVQQPAQQPTPHAYRFLHDLPLVGFSNEVRFGTVNMQGNSYGRAMYVPVARGGWTSRNLNAQYNTMTARIGPTGVASSMNNNGFSNIMVLGDGREIASFNIDMDFQPQDISIDVRGVSVLRIEIDQPLIRSPRVAIANAVLT